jgi:hypothetical protein
MEIPPEVQDCVAFLGFDPSNAEDPAPDAIKVCGTAFFIVRHSEVRPRAGHVYLVTAKHVVDGVAHAGHSNVFVRVNMTGGTTTWFGTAAAEWVIHPDDSLVDVAVFPFATRVFEKTDQRLFPISSAAMHADLRNSGIGVGEELFFPGLFWRHYGRDRNLPIVRTGTIAAMPLEKLPVRHGRIDAYLVEARSIGGLSGSPVFVRMDPRKADEHWVRRVEPGAKPMYGLLGLIRGHFEAEAEKDATADALNAEAFNMGIGIVVPVEKIVETLMHPELVEKYDEMEALFERELPPEHD